VPTQVSTRGRRSSGGRSMVPWKVTIPSCLRRCTTGTSTSGCGSRIQPACSARQTPHSSARRGRIRSRQGPAGGRAIVRAHATSPGYTGSRSILASLLLLAAIGCDGKGGTPATESSDPAAYAVMLPRDARDSALVAAARVARAAVDSQVHASPGSMILVAGLANGSMALVSAPGGWPESTAVSYDVFPDQRGQVPPGVPDPVQSVGRLEPRPFPLFRRTRGDVPGGEADELLQRLLG
jgi:hypothetical protein